MEQASSGIASTASTIPCQSRRPMPGKRTVPEVSSTLELGGAPPSRSAPARVESIEKSDAPVGTRCKKPRSTPAASRRVACSSDVATHDTHGVASRLGIGSTPRFASYQRPNACTASTPSTSSARIGRGGMARWPHSVTRSRASAVSQKTAS